MLKTESAHDRMATTSKDGIIYAPKQLVDMHETEEDRTQNADRAERGGANSCHCSEGLSHLYKQSQRKTWSFLSAHPTLSPRHPFTQHPSLNCAPTLRVSSSTLLTLCFCEHTNTLWRTRILLRTTNCCWTSTSRTPVARSLTPSTTVDLWRARTTEWLRHLRMASFTRQGN